MSKLFIERDTLTSIADAIREKGNFEMPMTPASMADEIRNLSTGAELPEEALTLSGDCYYKFFNSNWDWFIERYGNQITTQDITNADSMFNKVGVTEIPFDINLAAGEVDCDNIFVGSEYLIKPPYIKGKPKTIGKLFSGCSRLVEIPEDWADYLDMSTVNAGTTYSYGVTNFVENCYSLRSIPKNLIDVMYNSATSGSNLVYYNSYKNLRVIDELRDMPVPTQATFTSNIFYNTFYNCNRLKAMTFKTNEDGTPIVANWKSQTITATNWGYITSSSYANEILDYSDAHGITEDTAASDDTTYQALKDNPDYWAIGRGYSRYNHDSAVATINSLPDTSAYLAANGGTNTIKFTGAAGSNTDGGAINTLTEEEIAVATAKGWTVSLA